MKHNEQNANKYVDIVTYFWNNFHQVRTMSEEWKAQ